MNDQGLQITEHCLWEQRDRPAGRPSVRGEAGAGDGQTSLQLPGSSPGPQAQRRDKHVLMFWKMTLQPCTEPSTLVTEGTWWPMASQPEKRLGKESTGWDRACEHCTE